MTYQPPTQPVHSQHAPTQPVHGQLVQTQPTAPVAYPDYPDTPPPRRSNGPLLAVVVALAVLLVGGIGVAGILLVNRGTEENTDNTAGGATHAPSTSVEESRPAASATTAGTGEGRVVVYEVTGDGPVSIVYLKEDGRTPAQARDADLPWRMELTLEDDAPRVTVTAIRGALSDGTIECRVTIDGEEVAKRSSSGTFATATCTDRVS
jgi:Mycobacterium membrane protein